MFAYLVLFNKVSHWSVCTIFTILKFPHLIIYKFKSLIKLDYNTRRTLWDLYSWYCALPIISISFN